MSKYTELKVDLYILKEKVAHFEDREPLNTEQIRILKQQVDRMLDFEFNRVINLLKPHLSNIKFGGVKGNIESYTVGKYTVNRYISFFGAGEDSSYLSGINTFYSKRKIFEYVKDYYMKYKA